MPRLPAAGERHMSALIATQGLTLHYGVLSVLRDVTMSISPGEIVTIVGPNGSGKSSLLKALIGSVPITSGSMSRQNGLRIGYVPQKLALDPTLPMTVQRFLSLPRRLPRRVCQEALETAGVPQLMNRQLSDLSGGQIQRVLLARAVLEKPQLLILDEPTQGLDQPGASAFYQQIEQLRQELGCAVLMVSHDLHVVMATSDRVLCMNGHICCEGAPESVASAPEYRALFGSGTQGALALYRHEHSHSHDPADACDHDHLETHETS